MRFCSFPLSPPSAKIASQSPSPSTSPKSTFSVEPTAAVGTFVMLCVNCAEALPARSTETKAAEVRSLGSRNMVGLRWDVVGYGQPAGLPIRVKYTRSREHPLRQSYLQPGWLHPLRARSGRSFLPQSIWLLS